MCSFRSPTCISCMLVSSWFLPVTLLCYSCVQLRINKYIVVFRNVYPTSIWIRKEIFLTIVLHFICACMLFNQRTRLWRLKRNLLCSRRNHSIKKWFFGHWNFLQFQLLCYMSYIISTANIRSCQQNES